MNFNDLNLDLQGVARRTYENLIYRSSGFNFMNMEYIGDIRNTGTAVIEVIKQLPTNVVKRTTEEIETPLSPGLSKYESVLVNLTDLKLDYSFSISPNVTTTNISGLIDGQIDLRDSQIATETDEYIFNTMGEAITGPADGSQAYINGQVLPFGGDNFDYTTTLNNYKAILFNRKMYDNYKLGLESIEYGKFVASMVSLLKFETRQGVGSVDMGEVGFIYGIDVFAINSEVLPAAEAGKETVGFFGHPIGMAGDYYFNTWAQYPGNYPGLPGYWVMEGSISFGCKVIRPEAIIKLEKTVA